MDPAQAPAPHPPPRPIHHRRGIEQYFRVLGPGVVSGAADNDPSGVVTYTQVGATTGFHLLWLMLVSTLVLYVLEEMSARLGIVHKRGLAHVMRERFGFGPAMTLGALFIASNVVTLSADLTGTATALGLLVGAPWQVFVVPLAAILSLVLVRGSYAQISRGLLLLTPLFLLYVVTGFWVRPDWGLVLRSTFVPSLSLTSQYLTAALGLLGATLTPYMFFWQTEEEVEHQRSVSDLKVEQIDVAVGMIYANLVFSFIILTAAATLFASGGGQRSLRSVEEAATALRPLLGDVAFVPFGVALLASGLISVPVMAAATAYLVAEVAGWREGLDRSASQARGFYVVLVSTLATGAGFALLGVDPVFLLFWSQVLNGAVLPILFTLLLLVTNDREIMGPHRNSLFSNLVGWATVGATSALALLTVASLLEGRAA